MLAGIDLSILPARFGVAVSGGADSVALLRIILTQRNKADVIVIHFNHQLRGQAADEDEFFVRQLCVSLGVNSYIIRKSELMIQHPTDWPANDSARYRAMRHMVFQQATHAHALDAIALAHHANDQAETVALRLLRGASLTSLGAMQPVARNAGLTLCRPLLHVTHDTLHNYLQSIHQPWREDASNTSNIYRRNVVRKYLSARPMLYAKLCAVAQASQRLKLSVETRAPQLAEIFDRTQLQQIDVMVAECAARRWLVARGCPAEDVSPRTCGRLIRLATDITAPARSHFPGGIYVRRRAGKVFVEKTS
jgi:tRNA(Ile)-lysidine synthetase-like protein